MKLRGVLLNTIGLMITLNCFSQNIFYKQQSELSRPDMIENLRTYIAKVMSRNKIVGLSIAVVDKNGILLSEGFGEADKENKVVANSSTLFPIASVTKTFTGIAVMQLVEKGLIDLDKPIAHYIPELSLPNGEESVITIRMLLTHHSGIHGDILYNWYLPEVSKNPLIYEQVIPLINNVGTVFQPGKLHSYSNAFAGENTNCIISKGYNGKETSSMPMKLGIPAGGIALTANDAAKYMMGIIDSYHCDNALLKQETMLQMMTQQNSDVPLDKGFAIGLTWFLQNPINLETKYAAHRGESPPYYAMMVILPDLKIGVFISVNTNSAADLPEEMAHKIIEDLYEYQAGKPVPQIKHNEVVTLSKEQLKKYEGIYPNVYFGPMEIKIKGKNLTVKSPVMPTPMVLIPHVDSTFTMKAKLLGITFPIKTLNALKVEFRENEDEKYIYFAALQRLDWKIIHSF